MVDALQQAYDLHVGGSPSVIEGWVEPGEMALDRPQERLIAIGAVLVDAPEHREIINE